METQIPLFTPHAAPRPAHPAADQHIQLGKQIVAFRVTPARRRLTLHIDENGLRVGLPRHVTRAQMEAFIRQHGAWVLEKLDQLAQGPQRQALTIRDGVEIPVLGRALPVRITVGNNRARWFDNALELAARPGTDLDALTRRALQQRALALFVQRLAHFAPAAGLSPDQLPRLALTSARTRWGSCSRLSGIRLNWRLIHLPLEIIDYVVVHELSHLKEMNHSPRFWAEVAKLCPDWQTRRAELKHQGAGLPMI